METDVKNLIKKAEAAKTADEAMKYSQAAVNAANALSALNNIKVSNRT